MIVFKSQYTRTTHSKVYTPFRVVMSKGYLPKQYYYCLKHGWNFPLKCLSSLSHFKAVLLIYTHPLILNYIGVQFLCLCYHIAQ